MKTNIIKLMLTLLLLTGVAVSYTPEKGLQFSAGTQAWAMDDDDEGYWDGWDIDDWCDYINSGDAWDDGIEDTHIWDDPDDFYENADWDVIEDVLESLEDMGYDSDHIENITNEFYEHNEEYREHVEEEREHILNEINERNSNGEFHPYFYEPKTNTLYTSEGNPVPHGPEGYFNGDDLYRDDNGNGIPDRAEDGVIGEIGIETGGTEPVESGGDDGECDMCGIYNKDGDDGGSESNYDPCDFGECGDDDGGDVTPPVTPNPYPKATALFRNPNMTNENWQVIENMLNKITQDCLGQALYNGLLEKLNGSKLAIEFVDGRISAFRLAESKIMIGIDIMNESNILFHEMFHAYQAYAEVPDTYWNSLLNGEFEAHYAQYLYLKKMPEYQVPGNRWAQIYTQSDRGITIWQLERFVDSKGRLLQEEYALANYLFTLSQYNSDFRRGGYENYPYNYDRPAGSTFNNLKTLAKDC